MPARHTGQSTDACGIPTSDNNGSARRYRLGHKRVPQVSAVGLTVPPDLSRWEKTGPSIHGSATMRNRDTAAKVKETVNSSRSASWLSASRFVPHEETQLTEEGT